MTSTQPAKIGVGLTAEGWAWLCSCGESSAAPVKDRVAARNAYKVHRASHTAPKPEGTPAADATPPQQEKDPVATKKKTTQKKVTKKAAASRKKATGKKATGKKVRSRRGKGGVWCFAKLTTKGDKKIFPRLGANGMLDSSAAERLGVKQQQKEWWEVEAATQKEATAIVRKGGGKKITLAKRK